PRGAADVLAVVREAVARAAQLHLPACLGDGCRIGAVHVALCGAAVRGQREQRQRHGGNKEAPEPWSHWAPPLWVGCASTYVLASRAVNPDFSFSARRLRAA